MNYADAVGKIVKITKDCLSARKMICLGIMWAVSLSGCFTGISVKQAAASPTGPISLYPWEPFAKEKVLPLSWEPLFISGETIKMTGTPGAFEPGSFVIRAHKDIRSIEIKRGDLKSNAGKIIPANAIDIRMVKCWYQAGEGTINNTGKRVLTPELLLHDDGLVKVDYRTQSNYLRVTLDGREQYVDISSSNGAVPPFAMFDDSPSLRPFRLEANSNKQVWVTVHIPANAVPGKYAGKMAIYVNGKPAAKMNLQLTVLPFVLPEPMLDYAIYYRGTLTGNAVSRISADQKTPEQYRAELKNMAEHGIQYPTLYQLPYDPFLKESFELRDEFGFRKDKLFTLGTTTANKPDEQGLRQLNGELDVWEKMANSYGYGRVYVYGIDEAVGDRLKAQRLSWDLVHERKMGVFTALYEGAVKQVGDVLDQPVLSGYKPKEVERWHALGKRVYCYGNPHAGIEDPLLYRENYGLALWVGGYDGSMQYAYQDGFGEIWNDFDHPEFRDHVFAYPTRNGVIDTIEWEGFRAGVDDVRYLTLLLKLGESGNRQFREELRSRLKNPGLSLDDTRVWLTERILALKNRGKRTVE
jgi:hypothetical protein